MICFCDEEYGLRRIVGWRVDAGLNSAEGVKCVGDSLKARHKRGVRKFNVISSSRMPYTAPVEGEGVIEKGLDTAV